MYNTSNTGTKYFANTQPIRINAVIASRTKPMVMPSANRYQIVLNISISKVIKYYLRHDKLHRVSEKGNPLLFSSVTSLST